MMKLDNVSLVGASPNDPELLTIKVVKAIAQADEMDFSAPSQQCA